jgi:hypothetical protein
LLRLGLRLILRLLVWLVWLSLWLVATTYWAGLTGLVTT